MRERERKRRMEVAGGGGKKKEMGKGRWAREFFHLSIFLIT